MPNGHLLQQLLSCTKPDIYINEDMLEKLSFDKKLSLVESSPTMVFDIDKNTRRLIVVDPEAYTCDDEVIKKCESLDMPGLIKIHPKVDSFIFTVEFTGAIKASQLVINAIDILKQKLDAVRLSEGTV